MAHGRREAIGRLAATRGHRDGRLGELGRAIVLARHDPRLPGHQDVDLNGHALWHSRLGLRDQFLPYSRADARVRRYPVFGTSNTTHIPRRDFLTQP